MNRVKKQFLFPAILVVGIAAFLAYHHFARRGPVFEGRGISYWFNEAGSGEITETPWLAMGQEALPFIVAQLHKPDSRWTDFYWKLDRGQIWTGLPDSLRHHLPEARAPFERQEVAATILCIIGSRAQSAVPDLISEYNREFVQRYALPKNTRLDWSREFTNAPPSLPASGGFARDNSDMFRGGICGALAQIGGTNRELIPLLLAASRENALRPWSGGWSQNTNLAPTCAVSKSILITALNDPNGMMRAEAVSLLGLIIPGRKEVITPLVECLKDADSTVRLDAISALASAEMDPDAVLPALCGLLGTEKEVPRAYILTHIRTLAEHCAIRNHADKFQLLLDWLSNTNASVRAAMAEELALMGPEAKAALPRLNALTDETKEPNLAVRRAAAEALWAIGGQASALIPFRIEDLRGQDSIERWRAAYFLGNRGAEAKVAVPGLIEMLQHDPNRLLRIQATIALGHIGVAAQAAATALEQATQSEDPNLQAAAADALLKIAPQPTSP